MYVEQIYTGCLAEASYYIESEGEAAVIDPIREPEPYIELAKKRNAKIKYVFETHFHADFVSGHVDLANKTGAIIVFGPGAKPKYKIHEGKDGEIFKIGKTSIKLLHTPGHTLESSTFLLLDENGKEHAIFTGDTLFLGDVGRPDLAIKSDLTKEDLAGMLYDSLRKKIMPLPDEVIVYPGHGAGSACGKNMSKETVGILGDQKKTNYALNPNSTKEDFIKQLLDGILPPPQYFALNAKLNKEGYKYIDSILNESNNPLDIEEFERLSKNALIIDTRSPEAFAKGHIPNSLFVGLNGSFAVWVGALVADLHQPILLITEEGKEEEAIIRLARVGYDNCLGFLKGSFEAWLQNNKPVNKITSIPASELENRYGTINILDVRKPTEYEATHIEDAKNIPLDFIYNHIDELDKNKTYYVHCQGGYRSMIAASIMEQKGFKNIIDVAGGFQAIEQETKNIPITAFVCQSTN
ncbi:MAG: MBL fold metallo-hydrolase [Vicingaceae bacterium]